MPGLEILIPQRLRNLFGFETMENGLRLEMVAAEGVLFSRSYVCFNKFYTVLSSSTLFRIFILSLRYWT